MAFLSARQVLTWKRPGERVAFLLRHAERRHILPTDADYGSLVPLTERGLDQAISAGKDLAIFKGSSSYRASPVFRCRQTASQIAIARGDLNFDDPRKIEALDPLGDFFVSDFGKYEDLLRTGFYPAICRYVAGESVDGLFPLESRSRELLNLIVENSPSDFNLFVGHDAWIVPLLSSATDVRFSPSHWLNFLSGAAILFDPRDGSSVRVFPVKFLGDGFLNF